MMPTTASCGGDIPNCPWHHGGHVRPRLTQSIKSTGTVSRAARFDWENGSGESTGAQILSLRGRYPEFPTRAFWRATYMNDTYIMAVRARRADPISGKQKITGA